MLNAATGREPIGLVRHQNRTKTLPSMPVFTPADQTATGLP